MMFIVSILALGIGSAVLWMQSNRYFNDKDGNPLPVPDDLWKLPVASSGMQNTLYAIGGIAFIMFFVGWGMSYRTWRVHTLIATFILFCLTVVLSAFTIQQLHVHRYWGEQANQLKKEIEKFREDNKLLEEGKEDEEKVLKFGIKQLKERIVDVTRDRGRMWTGAQPSSVDPATGEVKVTVTIPKEHQIKPKMLLYAFEERPAGTSGAYLGAFRVTSVLGGEGPMEEPMPEEKPAEGDMAEAEKPAEPMQLPPMAEGAGGDSVVTLVPAWRSSPGELGRIKNSAGPWVLHDKMPPDNHESLVKVHVDPLTEAPLIDPETQKPLDREAQIKRLVPESVAAEYIKDYQPAAEKDPQQRVAVLVQFLKDFKLPVVQAPAPAADNGAAPGGGGFRSWWRPSSGCSAGRCSSGTLCICKGRPGIHPRTAGQGTGGQPDGQDCAARKAAI